MADVGGADGSVLVRLLVDEPERRGAVFDLPTVVPAARERIAQAGLTDRVRVAEGSFFETAPGADVYLLSMVLHDWDDEACRTILHQLGRVAEPGARLVVLEVVMPSGNEPHFSRLTDLTMLGMVESRERTEAEFDELFSSAGFHLDRVVTTPSPYSFLEATLVRGPPSAPARGTSPGTTPRLVGVHPLASAIAPLLDQLGATAVPVEDREPNDVLLYWEGEPVVAVRLPGADMTSALDRLIAEVETELGGALPQLSRPDKQRAVRLLEERGAFTLRKSVEAVAKALGVSRFTVYNYLNRE